MPNTPAATPSSHIATFFICALCDKPFTKEPQYKRHIAYCSKSHARTRPRSCRACNQAKIKCNSCTPCQQCVRKGVRCLYDRRGRAGKGLEEDVATAVTVPATNTSLDLEDNVTMTVSEPSVGLELRLSNLEAEGIESNYLANQFDQDQALEFGAPPDLSPMQYSLSEDGAEDMGFSGIYDELSPPRVMATAMEGLVLPSQSTSNNNFTNDWGFPMDNFSWDSGKELQMPMFSLSPMMTLSSFPSVASPSTNPISASSDIVQLAKNKVQTCKGQIFVTMIIDLIHAYPRMMMRRETFPPFVHACFPAGNNQQNKLPSHLTSCMGIAQLFAVCNDDTRLFVWETIWAELRGFKKRAELFDKYEAVSALQACLVYLIMRKVGDVPLQARHDREMLSIYAVVLNRVMKVTSHTSWREETSKDVQWVDWIFAETDRRIGCIWFILGLVFKVSTGTPCFVAEHFREIPLPCNKTEWEAKAEHQWRIEHENSAARGLNLRTFGDLVDAHNDRSLGNLDVWNAGIDHMGVLLNLAVQLV